MNPAILRRIRLSLVLLAIASLVPGPAARAQEEDDEFQPRSGTPAANRTGGASRSASKSNPTPPPQVSILAPAKAAGLTTREQTVVYWYTSTDTEHPAVISLTDPAKLDESVEVTVPGPIKAGVHKLDFATSKEDGKALALKPGVKYELVVEVVVNKAAGGSENPSATCRIVRMNPKEAATLDAIANEKDAARRAAAYAKEGVWFEYMDALNEAIAQKPGDEALLQRRAKALAAQGLKWAPDGTITEQNEPPGAAKE